MSTTFKLISNFNTKLEFYLSRKADEALDYGVFSLFLSFIEYLIIRLLINIIM